MFPNYISVEAATLTESTSIALAGGIKLTSISTFLSKKDIATTYVS